MLKLCFPLLCILAIQILTGTLQGCTLPTDLQNKYFKSYEGGSIPAWPAIESGGQFQMSHIYYNSGSVPIVVNGQDVENFECIANSGEYFLFKSTEFVDVGDTSYFVFMCQRLTNVDGQYILYYFGEEDSTGLVFDRGVGSLREFSGSDPSICDICMFHVTSAGKIPTDSSYKLLSVDTDPALPDLPQVPSPLPVVGCDHPPECADFNNEPLCIPDEPEPSPVEVFCQVLIESQSGSEGRKRQFAQELNRRRYGGILDMITGQIGADNVIKRGKGNKRDKSSESSESSEEEVCTCPNNDILIELITDLTQACAAIINDST